MSDDFYFKPVRLIELYQEVKARHPHTARPNFLEEYSEDEIPNRVEAMRVLLSRTLMAELRSLFKLGVKHPCDRRIVAMLVNDPELDIRHKALNLMCMKPGYVSPAMLWTAFCEHYADAETCHYIKLYLSQDSAAGLNALQLEMVSERAESTSAGAERVISSAAAARLSLDELGALLQVKGLKHDSSHSHERIEHHIQHAVLVCKDRAWVLRFDVYYVDIFERSSHAVKNLALRTLIALFPVQNRLSQELKEFIRKLSKVEHVKYICQIDESIKRWFMSWQSIFDLAEFFQEQSEEGRERFVFWLEYLEHFSKPPRIIQGHGSQKDILLMWFDNHGVVEFNESGAAYIYDVDDFDRVVNNAKGSYNNGLYKKSYALKMKPLKMTHRGGWQVRFRAALASKLSEIAGEE
jgi:hypothetical protein